MSRTIYFSSGLSKKVDQEIVDILLRKMNGGTNQNYQTFTNQKGEFQFTLNLNHITYIE